MWVPFVDQTQDSHVVQLRCESEKRAVKQIGAIRIVVQRRLDKQMVRLIQ